MRTRFYRSTRLTAKLGEFLTDEQIYSVAPSVYAIEAHSSRSQRFSPVPTGGMLMRLREEGFEVTMATQSRSRDESRREFTKHMIRLRRRDATAKEDQRVGMVFPEVVLVNANDGTAAYRLSAGLFRLVCLNGMVVADTEFGSVRVMHVGDETVGRVIEGSHAVLQTSNKALAAARRWSQVQLTRGQQVAFAEQARVARFGDAEGKVASPITAAQLLLPRRTADAGDSLWHVFNRVQENVIKGGLHGVTYDENNRRRNVTTREVQGIDQDMRLNRTLWEMAEKLAA